MTGNHPNVPGSAPARPCTSSPARNTGALLHAVGICYLILMPLNIGVRGPLFLHDVLAPVFIVFLVLTMRKKALLDRTVWPLMVFICMCAFGTLVHFSRADIYELAIFVYMACLFLFFSKVALNRTFLRFYGLSVLGLLCLYFLAEILLGARSTYAVYEGTVLSFIATRFFFTFSHPNLLGSFYVLPALCLLLGLSWRFEDRHVRHVLLRVVGVGALCIPLAFTVSRHMLLTFGVILGYFVCGMPDRGKRRWLVLSVAALVLVFVVFSLTVLFPFFPLQQRFPFFNHTTLGMYTIHQWIYVRLVFSSVASFWVGVGRSGVAALYPGLADWDSAHAILSQYGQGFLTDSFTTYMDAHCEYLNLAATFGVPATVMCFAWWARHIRQSHRCSCAHWMLSFYAASVMLAAFWDDLLSKRWIWVGLGILMSQKSIAETAVAAQSSERDFGTGELNGTCGGQDLTP